MSLSTRPSRQMSKYNKKYCIPPDLHSHHILYTHPFFIIYYIVILLSFSLRSISFNSFFSSSGYYSLIWMLNQMVAYSWLRYLCNYSRVLILKGCFLSSNYSNEMPRAHISRALPIIVFSLSIPMISSGAAYPFVPINLLVILSFSDFSSYLGR